MRYIPFQDRTVDNAKQCSPNHRQCEKDITFGESLGMAMVAATGAGAAYNNEPLISSAAVAGASVSAQNISCKQTDFSKMVSHVQIV